MKIPLNEFEQIIDETILKRGLSYFKNGYVAELSEIENGTYEAIVEGTEQYDVSIKIKNNVIEEHQCNCPYDMGPVCKHIVAVIFYLQQDSLRLDEKKSTKAPKKKTKSVAQQVKDLLKTVSHDELKTFIEVNSKNDRKFRNMFLTSFGHLTENVSKEFYNKQLKSILKTATGRDGWISWTEMKYVVKTTDPFLVNAENYFNNNNFENVFYISAALLEEFTEALQYADDSNGDLGYFIDASVDLLSRLVQQKLPKTLKEEIFEYCISAFKKQMFKGWDWHMGMLEIASELAENESEADIIFNSMDSVNGEYEKERSQVFKLNLLRKFKDEAFVQNFIDAHLSNSSIRNEEITKAYESENFEKAIKLSEDGIECDEKEKPGLVKVWYNWLLRVAQAQNNTSKIIEYARFLFIDNFYPEQNYYQILKDTVEDKNWHPFLEEIIKEITPKHRWTYTELIRKIYIKEEWWDRLFVMLKLNVSLDNIEQNEKYLAKNYTPELIEMYRERITIYVETYMGRNHYQTACRYLRRMKKLGGSDKVNSLIEAFRKQYPQRKALMDELNKV